MASDLADDDPVGAPPQRGPDQLGQVNGAGALDVGLPAAEGEDVGAPSGDPFQAEFG